MCLNFSFSIKKSLQKKAPKPTTLSNYLWKLCKIYVSKGSNFCVGKIYQPGFCLLQIFNEVQTWLQKAFKGSGYGESGIVAQAGRITWDLLGQILGDFAVDVSSRKFMQQLLLSSAVPKIKSSFVLYGKHRNKEQRG